MNPAFKYGLGRLGVFAVCMAVLLPFNLNALVKLMIALLASMVLSIFVLKKWRDEASEAIGGAVHKRREEKERMRAALAGDDE